MIKSMWSPAPRRDGDGKVMNVIIEYDSETHATYVSLSDVPPVRQIEVRSESVAIDLDEHGQPIGVEILFSPTEVTPEIISAIDEQFPELGQRVARALVGAGYHAA